MKTTTENKLGTRWVAPGEGATISQLYDLCQKREDVDNESHFAIEALASEAAELRMGRGIENSWEHPSNLALTGSPLTATDLERIASAEFKVGR